MEATNVTPVALHVDDEVRLSTAPDFGLVVNDCPDIRHAIRKYAMIQFAAKMVLDKRHGKDRKWRVLAVRDTEELLMDGRPALDVVYEQELAQAGGLLRERTLIPIETINDLVTRMESGEIPADINQTSLEWK